MKYRVRFYLIAVASLAGLLLTPLQVSALDSTATVIISEGSVSVSSSGDQKLLSEGDDIFVRDRVETGDESYVVLRFIDGAKVTIRPNSVMVIEEYTYHGNAGDAATLRLVEGGVRVITGELAESNPENYRVETPNSRLDVRHSNGDGR